MLRKTLYTWIVISFLLTACPQNSVTTPDFSLSVANQISLKLGGTVDLPLSITRLHNFQGNVVIRLDNLPSSLSANSLSIDYPNNSGVLKLEASQAALAGSYQALIQASSGSLGKQQALNITLTQDTPQPTAAHPRLWLRSEDLPRLRAWAVSSNPIYQDGIQAAALEAKRRMDAGDFWDDGGYAWEPDPSEQYALLFAFMSLIGPEADRADYATRARSLLMKVISEAAKGVDNGEPYRNIEFSTSDRSRWNGSAFGLVVDWIYPSLSANDKASILKVFKRWSAENLDDDSSDEQYAYPCGQELSCFPEGLEQALNDPRLLAHKGARWSQNNYFTAHMRNVTLMALAMDEADDPDGSLRAFLEPALKRWLYVADGVLKGDVAGGLGAEGFEYSPQTHGYIVQQLLALKSAGEADASKWGHKSF
ncbi:MAG: hypothetical protein R2880_13345 [Deinococcales bacterium]